MSHNLAPIPIKGIANLNNVVATVKTILICTLFMIVGPTLILLNKFIMETLNFPYPIMLSGIGVIFSGLFSHFLVRFGFVQIDNSPSIVQGSNYYKRILPIAVSTAATLAFGNYVYLLLDVGFIQMLKSFTPVIVMFGLFLSGIETLNQPIIISICMISIGTAITCSFTPQINVLGLFVFLLSSGAEAVRMVLTQFLLKDLKLGVIESQYFLAIPTAVCLFTASATSEIPLFLASMTTTTTSTISGDISNNNNDINRLYKNGLFFLLAGFLGIIVNFLTYFVIQITSSLTLKILGTLRNVIVIVIGIVFYNEIITPSEGCGYFVALIGFMGYNAAQMKLWPQQRQEVLAQQKKMRDSEAMSSDTSSDQEGVSRVALLLSSSRDVENNTTTTTNNSNNNNNNNSNNSSSISHNNSNNNMKARLNK